MTVLAVVLALAAGATALAWAADHRRLRRRLAAAEHASVEARDEAATARAGARESDRRAAHAEARERLLWALEARRSARTWRHEVAPFPGSPSPLDATDDVLGAALGISAGAAREQTGVQVEVRSTLPPLEDPGSALVVLRTAEEALAAVVKAAEVVVVHLRAGVGGPEIELEALDAEGRPVGVDLGAEAAAALEGAGVALRGAGAPDGRTLPA